MRNRFACMSGLLALLMACLGACSESSPSEGVIHSHSQPVVGGVTAAVSDYPSTVALTDPSGQVFCTGTLVGPKVVLTAAHCLEDEWSGQPSDPSEIRVVYGYTTPQSAPSSARRAVASVHPHPSYNPYASGDSDGMSHSNDIGVVVLSAEIANAVIAPLLPAGQLEAELTPNRDIHIVGFGIYNMSSGVWGRLYKAITPEIRHIQWEMLAGRPGKPDTCNGDSGGPAYIVRDNTLWLVGVTSRAWKLATSECGDGGIYTLAPRYIDWISSFGATVGGGQTDGGFEGGGWEASVPEASTEAGPAQDAGSDSASQDSGAAGAGGSSHTQDSGAAGQGEAGQGQAGQGEAGQGQAGQGEAGQGEAGQGEAGQGEAGSEQPTEDAGEQPSTDDSGSSSSGCAVASSASASGSESWALLGLLGLVGLARRRSAR